MRNGLPDACDYAGYMTGESAVGRGLVKGETAAWYRSVMWCWTLRR